MYQINEFLLELGLTGKEIKTYIALLELGNQPASIIAKRTKLPRSSTLVHLNSLAQKGFSIKSANVSNTTYFRPVKPSEIKNLLNQRKGKLDLQLKQLSQITPELRSLASQFLPTSNISYYEGIEGACRTIDKIVEKDTPIYFISAHDIHPQIIAHIEKVYVPARKKMKTKCQMIIAKQDSAKKYVNKNSEIYEWIGYIITKEYSLKSTIVIYDNVVQFLTLNGQSIGGILIENNYIANTMKAVFCLLKNTEKIETIRQK